MTSPRSKEARTGSFLPAAAASAAAPLLVYLAIKAAASGAAPAAAVAMSTLPPADPAPVLRQVLRAAQSPKYKVGTDVEASAREALAQAPLAFEPFYIAARAAERDGKLDSATALLEEAKRRRPSYPAIRMQLAAYYGQAARYEDALAEVGWLLERDTQLRAGLMPELAKLLPLPEGRAALAKLLAREPAWRGAFAAAAAAGKVNPAHARALYEAVKARKPRGNLDVERQIIMQAQIGNGEYVAARSTGLAGLPQNERAANALLFDGDFSGERAPKPFAWSFLDNQVGRAAPAHEGGTPYLDISFFGGSDAVLAEQVLALAPGQYSLRTLARREGVASGARIYWRITCLPGTTEVARLELPSGSGNPVPAAARFTVPSGCPGQSLKLVAETGEVSSSITGQISRVEIRR